MCTQKYAMSKHDSEETKYYLAMYDVRGKQAFIFRNNHIKEIVGASCIIRDCFEKELYPAAREYRNELLQKEYPDDGGEAIYTYTGTAPFNARDFRTRMSGENYLGEVIYNGGGNFIVLYQNRQTCIEINKRFTRNILEKYNGLNVLCAGIEVDRKLDNYIEDRRRLYEQHRILEASDTGIRPVNTLPFVQVDHATSLPLAELRYTGGSEKTKVSAESAAKYDAYEAEIKSAQEGHSRDYGEKILDDIIVKKGVDSKLAVIFIDGNNMGAQVQSCLDGKKTYEECISELRVFSDRIQREYVDDRLEEIDKALEAKYGEDEKKKRQRLIVHAGDEMSFICRAEDALMLVKAYFRNLPPEDSSCAGIAVFHSHSPYASAYKIAEECCENGKKKMKRDHETGSCYVDFHYCQGGIGMDLDDIRYRETGDLISKPWLIRGTAKKPQPVTLAEIEAVVQDLNKIGSRTNIKGLAAAAKASLADFDMEMARIYAHQKEEVQNAIKWTFKELGGEERRRMIYDIAIMYDLWFRNKTAKGGKDHDESNQSGSI